MYIFALSNCRNEIKKKKKKKPSIYELNSQNNADLMP